MPVVMSRAATTPPAHGEDHIPRIPAATKPASPNVIANHGALAKARWIAACSDNARPYSISPRGLLHLVIMDLLRLSELPAPLQVPFDQPHEVAINLRPVRERLEVVGIREGTVVVPQLERQLPGDDLRNPFHNLGIDSLCLGITDWPQKCCVIDSTSARIFQRSPSSFNQGPPSRESGALRPMEALALLCSGRQSQPLEPARICQLIEFGVEGQSKIGHREDEVGGLSVGDRQLHRAAREVQDEVRVANPAQLRQPRDIGDGRRTSDSCAAARSSEPPDG